MSDCSSTEEHLHKQIKEFQIYRTKNTPLSQKGFTLMYSCYFNFPVSVHTEKKYASPSCFSNIINFFFDSYTAIHHSHVTRKIHSYAHKFCNKKVRKLTDKSGQYFSCIFHNVFRFDITFLTKGLWLYLWRTKDVSILGSRLTSLKSHNIGRHINFIDSTKYYQQPLLKLVRSTDVNKKQRIRSLFLD